MVLLSAASAGDPAGVTAPTQDFTTAEPLEALPGGAATSKKHTVDRNAFSQPSGNLDFKHEFDFRIGNGIFRKTWVTAPASTEASDGLGPLFNARACQNCHLKDGRGHPPSANWPEDNAISMLVRLSIPPQTDAQRMALEKYLISAVDEPVYGGQLQDFAIQGQNSEGQIHIAYEELPVRFSDGTTVSLRKPAYTITDPGFGAMHPDVMLSPRVANPMIGLGLLEAVRADDILALADPDDRDGDGISGRPNRVWSLEHKKVMLGRFGWKAGQPTIAQQTAAAFAGDMGISSPLMPGGAGDCTKAQTACLAAPDGNTLRLGSVEASPGMFDLVVFYSRNLAVPRRRGEKDPQVLAGKKLFYGSGCISCHRPKFVTGRDGVQPGLAGQLIWPYTDMLLHDMGEGLADNRPEGAASGREWRTAPLWGIGLTETVSGHTFFLHDGRARSLEEAILWHGGEAEAAKQRVLSMSADDRARLIAFLMSL
ncbi:MAG: di-heme oxidoredictase family protein [Hyphomicrobiales bacterium]